MAHVQSTQPKVHWSIGLIPPAWMMLQMAIFFPFMDAIFRSTGIKVAFGLEALVTLILMFGYLNKVTGPKTALQKKWMAITSVWTLASYGIYSSISLSLPRPDYTKIGGTGDAHIAAVEAASNQHMMTTLALFGGYVVVMFAGIIALVVVARRQINREKAALSS